MSISIELYDLIEDPSFKYFNFEYDFYTTDTYARDNFEKKYLNHYMFHSIGAEVVYRHKRMLKAKLDKIMPYYKELYNTMLKAEGIEFLLNKDYTETFIRELDRENIEKGKQDTSNKSDSTINSTGNVSSNNDSKISSLDNGVASVGLEEGFLTGVSQDKNTGVTSNNNTEKREDVISGLSEKNDIGKELEKHTLIGKGNIGITSSAELLDKWRKSLINIDELIIDECRDMFLMVY